MLALPSRVLREHVFPCDRAGSRTRVPKSTPLAQDLAALPGQVRNDAAMSASGNGALVYRSPQDQSSCAHIEGAMKPYMKVGLPPLASACVVKDGIRVCLCIHACEC